MDDYCYDLVGRFPLGFSCRVKADVVILNNGTAIIVNENEFDSPVFLYKSGDKNYIQLASSINGCHVLVNENHIDFFDSTGNPVDLFEIPVKPLGSINNG